MDMTTEYLVEKFRNEVLRAMDEWSDLHGFEKVRDEDLTKLFQSIDPLAKKLMGIKEETND